MGGGLALSRDVGGSGGLQQSPLQYRGSGDTVQTIDGLRLNNLCAQGQFSGVLERSEPSGIQLRTGADSTEMGRAASASTWCRKTAAMRFAVWRSALHALVLGLGQLRVGGRGTVRSHSNLTGDTTFNKTNNFLTNVSVLTKNYDSSIGLGGPIVKDKAWFYAAFRYSA